MPRIRPLTGGGAVVGQVTRPTSNTRSISGDPTSVRSVARAPYEAPVRVVSGPRTFDGRIERVSERDVIVLVSVGLADGERVSTRFALPMSQKVVSIPTGVAHREARPGGLESVTLAFSIVDETLRKELEGYVKLMLR